MSLTLRIERVSPSNLTLAVESTSGDTGNDRAIEIVLIVHETGDGIEFSLSGDYGNEHHEFLRGSAPMEIYEKGSRASWRGF